MDSSNLVILIVATEALLIIAGMVIIFALTTSSIAYDDTSAWTNIIRPVLAIIGYAILVAWGITALNLWLFGLLFP